MNAKMYLAGIIGGTLCSLALWMPLAEYLPATLLTGWQPVNANLAWGLIILACLIVAACGVAAARMSGTKSRTGASISGAVNGLIAAMMSYIMVGGAAAGVWGARPILAYGLKPAVDDSQMIELIVDSLTGIHWWGMIALWSVMLIGLGLGALGGALAGPAGEPDPEIFLIYQVTAVCGMLTGALILIVNTAVLALLVETTAKSVDKAGIVPAYPINTMLVSPAVNAFLMMLISAWLWWVFYHQGAAAGQVMDLQVRLSAGTLLIAPILTLILTYMIHPRIVFYTLYLPFFVVIILTGALILRHVWRNSDSAWSSNLNSHVIMVSGGLCFIVLEFGNYISATPTSLGVVLLVITSISALTPEGSVAAPTITNLVQMVREHYVVYRNVGLASLPATAFTCLVISSLVLWLMRFLERRNLGRT